MTRHSTGAAATALLALVLAGCGSEAEESAPTPDTDVAAPTEDEAEEAEPVEAAPASIDDLVAGLLAPEEFPSAGWELLSAGPDAEDTTSGSVCTFDFDDAVPADAPAAEASYTNNTLMTFGTEGLVQVPDAETVLAGILTELEACVGQAEATADDGTTALITSEPLDFAVPGAAVGACRYAESVVDGTPLYGPFCFGASGDRMLMFAALSPDPNGGVTADELTAVLTAATAKAFAG